MDLRRLRGSGAHAGGGWVMTPLEILRGARALLADEARWTRGVVARNVDGDDVPYSESQAVCWCAVGAIFRSSDDRSSRWPSDREYAAGKLFAAAAHIGFDDFSSLFDHIGRWNDRPERTHAEVIAAFDRAIELAEKEE